MPYAPEGFERRIVGRDNIIAFVETIPAMIDAENLHDIFQLETYNSDPGEIVAEYKSVYVDQAHGIKCTQRVRQPLHSPRRPDRALRRVLRPDAGWSSPSAAACRAPRRPLAFLERPQSLRQRNPITPHQARQPEDRSCASASSIRRSTCPTPRTRISHSGATSSWSSCTTCSGSDEVWFGERRSGGCELIVDPLTFIAHVAPQTQRIKLGTGVISLPYHNPLWIAERTRKTCRSIRPNACPGGRAIATVAPHL